MTHYDQALIFLRALTGMASPAVTFQTFYDPKMPSDWNDPYAEHWYGAYDLAADAKLRTKQAQGCGVFMCVNGSTTGGRYQKDTDILRAVFIDSDGAAFPTSWPSPPHAILYRDPTHWHAYWFIDGQTTPDEWRMAQKQLALYFGTDQSLVNTDRVMRIPGYNHQKDLANPMPYQLHHCPETTHRYNLSQLVQQFPLTAEKGAELVAWMQSRSGASAQGIGDFDDSPANQGKYIEYLTQRAEIAVSGQGGNQVTFKTAAAGRDYGLSQACTHELMLEHWNENNIPPWDDAELWQPIVNAYKYGQNATGNRSLQVWLDMPFGLPPGASADPVGEIQHEIELPALAKLPKINPLEGDAIAMHGVGFNKNQTNNAQMFMRMYSPNGEMFVFMEEVYKFNGKVFECLDREILRNKLLVAMEHTMPSNSDVSGSLGILLTKMAEGVPKMPAWRGEPDRPVDSTIVFQNGILNLGENTFKPEHDINLLTQNILTYNYDPGAQCPEWEKFINGLWGTDPEMIECFRQWCGYSLVHDYRHQKIAVLVGKPRSGKGTIARVMSEMVGQFNVASPGLAGLAEAPVLQTMDGKLLAIISDAGDVQGPTRSQVMENLKRISGNDAITFNRKYLSAATSTMSTRLMLIANEFPYFNDPSGSIVDRILYFPFTQSHAGREDAGLTERLLKELPGIANWAIRGLFDLRTKGKFTDAKATMFQKQLLRRSLSPSLSFVSETLRPDPNGFLTDLQIYHRYGGWVNLFGGFKMSRDQLMRGIESAVTGVERIQRGSQTGFKGLAFAVEETAPPLGELP